MRRTGQRILMVLFMLSSSVYAPCAERSAEVKALIHSVQNNFHKIKTIQGKIKRVITFGTSEEASEGFFAQEVPHKVFLEFTTTPRQQLISDGETLWSYSEAKNEVIRFDNLSEDELATMQRFDINYLLDDMAESSAYTIDLLNRDENIGVLEIKPKSANPYVARILVKVEADKGAILAYETFAPNNALTNQIKLEGYRKYEGDIYYPQKIMVKSIVGPNQTMSQTAEFFRLEFNKSLADNQFQFTPPPGAKVITRADLRKK